MTTNTLNLSFDATCRDNSIAQKLHIRHPGCKQHTPCYCSCRKLVLMTLLIFGEVFHSSESIGSQIIMVEPQVQYDASGKNDIKLMRQYFQEASWETPISSETWKMLKPLGASKTRLINIESRKAASINPDTGELHFDFSSLLKGLTDCKNYSLIPHIIVGNVPQISLASSKKDDKYYGVSDWTLYEKYAYAFLEFVMLKNGFSQADFEVGNEPDINGVSWLIQDSLTYSDPKMYRAYMRLYEAWAHAAERLAHEHPEIKLRIGGPAITPYSFGFGRLNWTGQFINDIVAQRLRVDFFSFHFYGSQQSLSALTEFGRYPSITKHADYIRSKLSSLGLDRIPLYVTEWAPSSTIDETPKGIINGNNVGAAWAARFLLDAAEHNFAEGSLLIFRDHLKQTPPNISTNNWGWGSLLLSDGETAKAIYNVALMFTELPEQRIKATPTRQGSIGVIAAANSSKVSVLVFNQNWDFPNSKELANSEQVQIVVKDLPFSASKVKNICRVVDETHGNPHFLYQTKAKTSLKSARLQAVINQEASVINGATNLPIVSMAPSSVTLCEITASESQ